MDAGKKKMKTEGVGKKMKKIGKGEKEKGQKRLKNASLRVKNSCITLDLQSTSLIIISAGSHQDICRVGRGE